MKQTVALMQSLMQDVARPDDISRIGAMEQKLVYADKNVDDVRGELEKIRARISAGRSSTASSSAPRETHEWQPRLAHIKGWAPYGSPVAAKLNKCAAGSLPEVLGQFIPEYRHMIKLLAPFIQNHQNSFELRAGDTEQLKYAAGIMTINISSGSAARVCRWAWKEARRDEER